MSITLKRQLTNDEKDTILERFGRKCFATGHPISPTEPLHFDHIKAFASSGQSELDNIAPMCEIHNKAKGMFSLYDFRIKLRLDDFFSKGDKQTLGNLLKYMAENNDIQSFGNKIVIYNEKDQMILESGSKKLSYNLYECPITGWKYFYATLPVEIINSDDSDDNSIGLQPRYLILKKTFDLFRHFQNHPVLQPSIGRVIDNKILIFDGQHKIASLLWTGRREFECKIYLNPDLRLLNQTNISAHDNFSQTRFFSSIMVGKLGTEFGAEFNQYKNSEDEQGKNETGFIRFINSLQNETRGEINKKFRSFLYNMIIKDDKNKLSKYVSSGNRGSDEYPITIDMLSKSIFTHFLYREPVEDLIGTESYLREYEIQNIIKLMNMLYDLAMNSWNPKAGSNDPHQIKLRRIFSSKSIMAWSDKVYGAICGKLELQDSKDRQMPFYRIIDSEDEKKIKTVIEKLIAWPKWSSPINSDIDRVLSDNVKAVGDWMKNNGLTTGSLMGAPE